MPGPAQAVAAAALARFDGLVLDLAALGTTPAAWVTRLRRSLQCPIVALGSAGGEAGAIRALDLGADAFLPCPLSPRRLQAQIAALLRLRHAAGHAPRPDALAPALPGWRVDRIDNRLLCGDLALDLTDAQSALLQCLLAAAGRVVPRTDLAAALPRGEAVQARSVDVYVHRLRRRLQQVPGLALKIEACRGRGYRITAPIQGTD
jgi:DNA-binding response OmpR family regulator